MTPAAVSLSFKKAYRVIPPVSLNFDNHFTFICSNSRTNHALLSSPCLKILRILRIFFITPAFSIGYTAQKWCTFHALKSEISNLQFSPHSVPSVSLWQNFVIPA